MGMHDRGRHQVPAALAGAETSTPAVVLKLDPNVLHHGGLGVIRSLGRMGVPVYGVHEGPLAPAASSRYLHGRCFWQPGAAAWDRIRDGLMALAERIGRPAVLLPTDDAGAIFLAEHGADLRASFIFPDPPAGLPREVAGKYSLHELSRRLGVPSPAAQVPESAAAARAFAARAGYPLIAKLSTPWQDGRLRSTSIVTTRNELDRVVEDCARAGAGLMLQEFIPGGPGTDWFFHGYCNASSTCRPAFTGVKERSYPAHAGLTSLPLGAERRPARSGHRPARRAGLPGNPRHGPAPGPPGRRVQAARLQPAAGRPVPAVPHDGRSGRGHGRLPRPHRHRDRRRRAGRRAAVPGREL